MNAPTPIRPAQCPAFPSAEDIERFRQDGYLAFSNVLTQEELTRARQALTDLVASTADTQTFEYRAPKSTGSNQSGGAFKLRNGKLAIQLEPGFDPQGKAGLAIDLQVRKFWSFCDSSSDLYAIAHQNSRIRSVLEAILGAEPLLFQEMALVKPPFIGSEKPWHQDNAYFAVEPLEAIVGVWIALDDAGINNGCMHVIPGGHRLGAFRHEHRSDCEIPVEKLDLSNVRPVPVPAGGAMFFYGMLPHETPPNRSAERRRALQFHYRSANSRIVDQTSYNTIFAEADGTPASCEAAKNLPF